MVSIVTSLTGMYRVGNLNVPEQKNRLAKIFLSEITTIFCNVAFVTDPL